MIVATKFCVDFILWGTNLHENSWKMAIVVKKYHFTPNSLSYALVNNNQVIYAVAVLVSTNIGCIVFNSKTNSTWLIHINGQII